MHGHRFFLGMATVIGLGLAATGAAAGPSSMTVEEARHLIARTGFGASPAEINSMTGLSYREGVSKIIAGLNTRPKTEMPDWTTGWAYPSEEVWALGATAGELFFANRYMEIEDLSQWWLGEMVATPSPLTERLTLFWHDHFATSFDAWENPQWMANQNAMFRKHAAGNFADLAGGILTDPAMLTYLTNTENFKEAPNENLAREYMELFTLGQGRGYSENDVKEVARALTGHGIDEEGGTGYRFWGEMHDFEAKTIFGQRGRFDAQDLPELVMQNPAFGPYIVEKLWLTFVSDILDQEEINRLTRTWKASNWEMKPLLAAIFMSDAFWDPSNRGRLVKSPVELLVGSVRSLGIANVDLGELTYASEDLGQMLFFPPNVAGWTSGTGWLTDSSAVSRATVMNEVIARIQDGGFEKPRRNLMMRSERSGSGAQVKSADPEDLRVGRIFGTWAETYDEDGYQGIGAAITLFDVSFGGKTWRSTRIWIDMAEGEAPSISIYVKGCAPDCLFGAVFDEVEDGWIWIDLDGPDRGPPQARALLAAIAQNMQDIVWETRQHAAWDPKMYEMEDEGFDSPPKFQDGMKMAKVIVQAGEQAFGASDAKLVLGLSRPNSDGLAGLTQIDSVGDMDDYFDERYDQTRRFGTPAKVYNSSADWAQDLTEGRGALSVSTALLAVRPSTIDTNISVQDLITQLVLSPEYQVK